MTTDSKHFLSGRKIIVSGAGLGGLTFVLSIFKFWDAAIPPPEVVIVDSDGRDESINRWPYELQLNAESEESALVGLRDLGLLDAIVNKATIQTNPDAVMNVWDKSWKALMVIKPKTVEGFAKPGVRITRTALLRILIEAVEGQTKIRWGTSVQDAKRLPNGQVQVSLLDKASGAATQEECDLLVAADGDGSTIRKIFRPKDVSKPTGYICMGGRSEFGSKTNLPDPIAIDNGIIVSGEGVAGVIVHVNDEGRVLWAIYKEEKTPRAEYDPKDAAAFKDLIEEARKSSKSIAEPFNSVIDKTVQDTTFVRTVVERDAFSHESPDLRGIIFIGDANRCPSSYINNGGSLAIRDGINLAKQLVDQKSLDAARDAYDKVMMPLATGSIKAGRQTMNTAHLSGWKWTMARTALSAGGFLAGKS